MERLRSVSPQETFTTAPLALSYSTKSLLKGGSVLLLCFE